MSDTRVAIVTNVTEYAGPGAARALAQAGYTVACHDESFAAAAGRDAFTAREPTLHAMAEQEPDDLVAAAARLGRIDVLVSNDFVPGDLWERSAATREPGSTFVRRTPLEVADPSSFRATLEALVVRPFLLARAVLPAMKERRGGTIVFITSAVSQRAAPYFAAYGAARSATTSMAQSLAVEAAPHGIQVNPIGPAWLESETYFPERHQERIDRAVERMVPLGRLGRQDELGALITYLASGQAAPATGQFVPFTAGARLGM